MKKYFLSSLVCFSLSCKKTENVERGTVETENVNSLENVAYPEEVDSISIVPPVKDSMANEQVQDSPKSFLKYSFVVIKTYTSFGYGSGRTETYATGIFETYDDMSEDEKYKILDEAQSKIFTTGNVKSRKIKSYDTYAEASRAREKILGIN
ncbi:hypothetical protein [Riemerella columbipharyngis]|uniref:Uncharacterized protein n=1 Tax=Riemerella columbipharyngis TaxID=1071918 RepID=A0A1G6YHB2_9FLAO|nr:hypothetical protein [Riemerella columbipharyngis]SDD89740.1 hypothetical protein SAMN05421544_101164 [Riemerella columbipharyngis]